MAPKAKGCLLTLFVMIIFISLVIFITYKYNNYGNYHKKQLKLIERLEFKGKVIGINKIAKNGKVYYVMCVKIDHANATELYIFNSYCAIKISDGIATIPGGNYDEEFVTDSVEINLNQNGKEKFYYKNGKSDEFPLSLESDGISANDLNICN